MKCMFLNKKILGIKNAENEHTDLRCILMHKYLSELKAGSVHQSCSTPPTLFENQIHNFQPIACFDTCQSLCTFSRT